MSFGKLSVRGFAVVSAIALMTAGVPATVASAAPSPIIESYSSSIFKAATPSAPRSITVRPSNQRVAVSWSKPANSGDSAITGYRVHYSSTSPSGPWTLSGTVTTRSRTVSGLNNGTEYWFRVTALNSFGAGTTAVSKVAVPSLPPSAPENVSLEPDSDQVIISWDPPSDNGGSNVTSYAVSRATSPVGPWRTVTARTTLTSTTAKGLLGDTSYWFRVTATNPVGTGPAEFSSTDTLAPVPPSAPTRVTAIRGNGQARVSWVAPIATGGAPITGYEVSYSDSLEGPWTETGIGTSRLRTIDGLDNGTPYWFRVEAINDAGSSEPGTTATSVTPGSAPSAPTDIVLSPSSTQMSIAWSEPEDTGGFPLTYAVTRSTTSSGPWTTVSANVSNTSITASGLAPNTNYWFRVVPKNVIGVGPALIGFGTTTASSAPSVPRSLAVTLGNTTASLSWTVPANNGGAPITGYAVSYAIDPSGPWTIASTSTTTTRSVTGLRATTFYYFRVVAINSAGSGNPASGSGSTKAPTRPLPPTGFVSVAGDQQVALNWNPPTSDGGADISSYRVYRATSSRGPWALVATGVTDTARTFTGLTNGTAYWFRVTAVNVAGEGTAATNGPAIPLLLVPSAPENVLSSAGNGQVELSWSTPSSSGGSAITGYTVYRATSPSGPWTMHATAINGLGATVTGLTNGTPYWFQITASNSAGEGAPVTSNSVTPVTVPGVPEDIAGISGENEVNVTWDAPTNNGGAAVSSYKVSYSTSNTGPWTVFASNVLTTSLTVTGLTNGTEYWFRVSATNSAGEGDSAVSAASVTPYPALSLSYPAGQFVYGSDAQTLAPTVSGGAGTKSYAITAGTLPQDVGFNTTTGVFTGPATAGWVAEGAQPGFPSTVTVSVTDLSGTISQQVVLTVIERPSAPQALSVTPGDAELLVSWTAPASNGGAAITGYTVSYSSVGATGPWTVSSSNVSGTFHNIGGISNGTAYWVKVTAENAVGSSDPVVSSNSVTPATTPSAPRNLNAVPGDSDVDLTWEAPLSAGGSAITGYTVYYSSVGENGPWTSDATGIVGTSKTVSGLTNGTAYWFRVTATNAGGEGLDVISTTSVTPLSTPSAPGNLIATPGVEEVELSWTEPANNGGAAISDYTIYYSTNSASGPWTMYATNVESTSTVVADLTGGTNYWFRVNANNSEGEGASAITGSAVQPFNYLALSYSNGDFIYGSNNGTVSPTTTGGSGVKTYAIVNGTLPADVSFNTSTGVFTGPATAGWTDPQSQAGFPANITVSVTDSTGTDIKLVTLRVIDKPSAPTSLTAAPGNTQVTLEWAAPESNGDSPITGYTVYRATNSAGPWTQVATVTGTSRTVTGLTNGTNYWFRVTANNAAGESAPAETGSVTPRTVPGAPTGVSGTAGDGQVSLTWSAPANNGGAAVTDYVISYGTSSSGPWTVFADGTSASTSATVTGLTNTTEYWFRVAAVNPAGTGTAAVSSASTTPFAALVLDYTNMQFTPGSNNQTLDPTVTGGLGAKTYAITSGDLPDGVTFNTSTGVFTGPGTSGWNFTATQVSAGEGHTCAVTSTGGVKCWGYNYLGALGDGTTTQRTTPVDVSGLTSGVSKVDTGSYFGCALLTDGTVKCWGSGLSGNLGDGNSANSSTPVTVSGITTAVDVAAGADHACAVLGNGTVQCWGAGSNGQLGYGGDTSENTPISVLGINNATDVDAGYQYSCARLSTGAVKCWGANDVGQLGNSTNTSSLSPVDVTGLTGVASLSGGWANNHMCAVTTGGAAKCWGGNGSGQLGNGSTANSNVPVDVTGLSSGVSSLATGENISCARMSNGTAKCWGEESLGVLGNGADTGMSRTTPVDVTSPSSNISSISAGYRYTCFVLNNGTVRCVGGNQYGQLGDGTTTTRENSVAVSKSGPQPGFPVNITVRVTDSTGNTNRVVALSLPSEPITISYASTQFSTGSNNETLAPTVSGGEGVKTYAITDGVLPAGITFDSATGTFTGPAASAWNFTATQISAGGSHSCAVLTDGTAMCWGYNNYGQLGDGTTTDRFTPVDVSGLTSGVASISAGDYHSCALLNDGTVKCWGGNNYGQLGDGTTTDRSTPVTVSGLSGATGITSGSEHTCAVLSDGTAKCWGANGGGQLGDGTTTNRSTPVTVSGLSGATGISAGYRHTCAVLSDGTAKCWGTNGSGRLGDGTTTNRSTPVTVSGLSGATGISAGDYHSCAVLSDGTAECWGNNGGGQLGDNTYTNRSTPVTVSGLSGATGITSGTEHTCAVLADGIAKCWGSNHVGQLGDGTTTSSNTPVTVSGVSGATGIGAGGSHSCAVLTDGTAMCWGSKGVGQLGAGVGEVEGCDTDEGFASNATQQDCQNWGGTWTTGQAALGGLTPIAVVKSGPQSGFPAALTVTVTDSSGSKSANIVLTNS